MRKLGIIAGNGALPGCLIEACRAAKRPFFVIGLKGHASAGSFPEGTPLAWVRVGAIGEVFRLLRKEKVADIVFIGGVRRPSLAEIVPDLAGLCFLFRLGFRMLGDDSLLKAIVGEAERRGFRVVGIDEIMPSLVVRPGVYGTAHPDKKDMADIDRGVFVARLLGQADVGQAVIVQRGLVLAVEGIEGTAALIQRTAALKRKGDGGVLVKVSKPQQDRRMDLPTIGPETVQAIFKAGFKGIAAEAGGALMAEAEKTVALADKLGIFIIGIEGKS